MTSWVKQIQYDQVSCEYYLEIEEIAIAMGWSVEDTLVWTLNDDGTATLSKKKEELDE